MIVFALRTSKLRTFIIILLWLLGVISWMWFIVSLNPWKTSSLYFAIFFFFYISQSCIHNLHSLMKSETAKHSKYSTDYKHLCLKKFIPDYIYYYTYIYIYKKSEWGLYIYIVRLIYIYIRRLSEAWTVNPLVILSGG